MKQNDEIKKSEELARFTDELMNGDNPSASDDAELAALQDTIRSIRSSGLQASPEKHFATKLRKDVLAAMQPDDAEAFKNSGLIELVGKLLTDDNFRKTFFQSPENSAARAGIQLSPAMIAAFKEMEAEQLQEWFSSLDERISKSGFSFDNLDDLFK